MGWPDDGSRMSKMDVEQWAHFALDGTVAADLVKEIQALRADLAEAVPLLNDAVERYGQRDDAAEAWLMKVRMLLR